MSGAPGEMPSHPGGLREHLTERILDAAGHEFVTAGIKLTGVADIARRAGVSEQVILQRWPNVGELVAAVVVRDLHARLGAITATAQRQTHLDDRIAEAFAAVTWFLDGHPLVGGAVRSDADVILATVEVSVAPIVTAGVAVVVDCVAGLVLDESTRYVDAAALREVLTRLTQSLLLVRGPSTPLTSRDGIVRYARQCVVPLVHAFSG
jgi:AcrR family transcriptional regulator